MAAERCPPEITAYSIPFFKKSLPFVISRRDPASGLLIDLRQPGGSRQAELSNSFAANMNA